MGSFAFPLYMSPPEESWLLKCLLLILCFGIPDGRTWAISLTKGGAGDGHSNCRPTWYVLSGYRRSKGSTQHLTNICGKWGVHTNHASCVSPFGSWPSAAPCRYVLYPGWVLELTESSTICVWKGMGRREPASWALGV